jgi:hypothetical protein
VGRTGIHDGPAVDSAVGEEDGAFEGVVGRAEERVLGQNDEGKRVEEDDGSSDGAADLNTEGVAVGDGVEGALYTMLNALIFG